MGIADICRGMDIGICIICIGNEDPITLGCIVVGLAACDWKGWANPAGVPVTGDPRLKDPAIPTAPAEGGPVMGTVACETFGEDVADPGFR